LSRYSDFLERRRIISALYFENIHEDLVRRQYTQKKNSIFFRFLLDLPAGKNFEDLELLFEARGIAVRKGVDELLHRRFGLLDNQFPNAVQCFNDALSIPILPFLNEDEVQCIIDVVNDLLG